MIPYLIKSASCLLLLLAFYQLFLEREKMHQFNRYYLLGSILFSFVVPLYTIYIKVAAPVFETLQVPNTTIDSLEVLPTKAIGTTIDYTTYLLGIYILISLILLIRFSKNLYKIIQKIRKNTQIPYQKAVLVLVNESILPHTFFHYIFINKAAYENKNIETELFTHELTHVTQKHTIDILLIEILQIIFWVNPIFIFIKKAIKLNHEFLADTNVISSHKNISKYQSLLLNKAAWNNDFYLASNLNYSLTKKRLLMMTTQKSHRKILFKKLTILPILAGFVLLFANRVAAQETITVTENQKPLKELKDKNEEQLYKDFYYKDIQIITTDKNGKKVKKNYRNMTEKEKARIIPPPPLKSKKEIPSKTQLNNWKDNTKYAIWIDNKVVNNTVLNNYKNTDFANFFDSFVHKNARSKRFPQTHQVSLTTNKKFENWEKENEKAFEKFKMSKRKKSKKHIKDFTYYNNKYLQKKDSIIKPTYTSKVTMVHYSEDEVTDKTINEFYYTQQTFSEKGSKEKKKFFGLSEKAKKKWLQFPPHIYKKKQISKSEFNRIKDEATYVVRINGIVASTHKLNTHKYTDFVTFSKSNIHPLAKIKQTYQYNLLTKTGLKMNINLGSISYKLMSERYSKLIKSYLNNKNTNHQVLVKQYQLLKTTYQLFTPEIIKKNNFKLPPPPPAIKVKKNKTKQPKQIANNNSDIKPPNFTFETLKGNKTVFKSSLSKTKLPDNVKYYLNDKPISKTKLNTIKVNSIDKVKVINIKKGEQAIYITSHK